MRFLEGYARHIQAPLRAGVNVLALRPARSAGRYLVLTDQGRLESCNVVIATGPYQRPQVPALAGGLPVDLVQLHASAYRHPAALPAGAVLVVGSGSSGCQIAEELLEAGRSVYLSVSRHRRTPRRYRGRDMFWWARALGYHDQTADAIPVAQRPLPPLITGAQGGHDIDFRRLAAAGMTLLGRVVDIREGQLILARDLEVHLGRGDQGFTSFKDAVDSYIRTMGLDAPPEDRMLASPTAALVSVGTLDLHAAAISSVIWATGYTLDFSWVELPIFDAHGYPLHHRGVTTAPGIYLLGLRWLHKLKSAFLCGVGEDAGYLAEQIA